MKRSGRNCARDSSKEYRKIKELLLRGELDPSRALPDLFIQGYELDREGEREHADAIYRQTIDLLESLCERGETKVQLGDVARYAFNHGMNLYHLGKLYPARASFRQAVEKYELLISMDVSYGVIERLATAMRWLAITQRQTGDAEAAVESYRRAIQYYRSLCMFAPSANKFQLYKRLIRSAKSGFQKSKAILDAKEDYSS